MQLGIFAKTFARPTLEECFDAVQAQDITCVQFNMSCIGLSPMPDLIDSALCDRIAEAAQSRSIRIAAISGTFNMIHPDPAVRDVGLQRLATLASACDRIGTDLITLCTGTRDPNDMWKRHPENSTDAAWNDLVRTMQAAIRIADQFEVTLAFEPETGNVIDSAARARRLIDKLGQPASLKVVFDPANLFFPGTVERMSETLKEAGSLLGSSVAISHAKDISSDGTTHPPAGQGCLDYGEFFEILKQIHFNGPLILHGLPETDVPQSVGFLRKQVRDSGLEETH